MNNKVEVELETGEKFEGYIVEPNRNANRNANLLFKKMKNGIFLKRETKISFFSYESIKTMAAINQ